MNSDIDWQIPSDCDYQDILYHQAEGIAKITKFQCHSFPLRAWRPGGSRVV